MMAVFAWALGILVVAETIAPLVAVARTEAPITFIFGDSLTEVGNNNFLQYSLAKSNYPWYGVDYQGGQPTGRFTNGRTIGDIISAKLGIPSPPPYLSLSTNDDAILSGVNYASGGAGILNDTGLYFLQRLSFDDQIDMFEKTQQAMKAKIGDKATEKLCNDAFYFIGLGSNDFVNNFLQPFLADAQQYTPDEFLDLLVSTLDRQLGRLYRLGAQKVVFHGLGPLGCIPSQRVKSRNRECLKRVNEWALQFNIKVQKLLVSLNTKLPDAHLTFSNTYPIVLDLINNPRSYGFRVSNTSCCNVDTNIGGLCLPNSKLCGNRKEYVFWDAFHPTDAANAVIAERLFHDPHLQLAPTPIPAPASAPAPAPASRYHPH